MAENNPQPEQTQQVQIKMDDAKIAGSYSNQVFITNTPEEFILDFYSILPNSPMGQLIQRIILNPEHARRLNAVLTEQIKKFDNKEVTPGAPANAPVQSSPNGQIGFDYKPENKI